MNERVEKRDSVAFVVAVAMSVAVAMIAQQIAGKAIRDAYFLTVFDADILPRVMTVASILSVTSVFGVTALYRRFAPATLVPLFFVVSAGLFATEWALSDTLPRVAATMLYIHTTSFGAVAISGFWGVMNERFDPHTAKRVIGRVASGATLGGVLGGLAAWQGASRVSIPVMLLILCGVNLTCGLGIRLVGGKKEVNAGESTDAPAWVVFEETPYLRHLAWLVAITALGTAGFDYVFKATAAASFTDKSQLVSFFALFYLSTGVVTFVLQNALAGRLLQRAGLSVSIATLPSIILGFGFLAFMFPALFTMVLLRGGAATVESSFYRSGYELLYTPLSPAKKRPAKTLIDVGGDKLGGALGAAIAVFLVDLVPGAATSLLLGISLVCAGAGIWISRLLAKGYLGALAENLASGRLAPDAVQVLDADTQAAVQETMAMLDHETVFGGAAMVRRSDAPLRPARQRIVRTPPPLPTDDPTGHLRALSAFSDRHVDGVLWALENHRDSSLVWVASLIPLLDEPEVGPIVQTRLQWAAPAKTGVLLDALLSRRTSIEVRRRLCDILSQVPTARSARGLQDALETEPFEIRFRVACALGSICMKNPEIRVDPEVIRRATRRAIERLRIDFFGLGSETGDRLSEAGMQAARTTAYCVRLLSVILPPEPLYDALDALGSDDAGRRGTGLEYLTNALPPALVLALEPYFKNVAIARYARKDDADIINEIETAGDGVTSLEALRRLGVERDSSAVSS